MPHDDKPSFWKKEISFGRKPQGSSEPEPDVEAAERPEPVGELPPMQEPRVDEPPAATATAEQTAQDDSAHSWLTRPLEEISDPPVQLETPEVDPTPEVKPTPTLPDSVTPSLEVVELPEVVEPLAEQSEEPTVLLPEPPPERAGPGR